MVVITSSEASRYFVDPSQQIYGLDPDYLPGEPFEYWAQGPFCGVFYPGPMQGVWMIHVAALPEGRGKLVDPALVVLRDFSAQKGYPLIMGWTPTRLRAAIALAKRVGFTEVGGFVANGESFTITTWRQKCQ